jgi:MFS family permease
VAEPSSAFSYPLYRRYWVASLAFVFAMQFRFIGSGWLVHQITDSPFWLGVPGILSAAATIVLTVPAGALADRMDHQRLLVGGRAVTGLAHLALGLVTVAGIVELWMVLVWSVLVGALAALTSPAQNAMLPRLIDRSAMASAVAAVGIGQAFLVTATGYAISTLLVASLRLGPREVHEENPEHEGMWAGVRYVLAQPVFFAIIGLSFFSSLFGRSYVVLLPIFADDVLGVGVQGFGFLEAAAGIGALLGTLSITRIRVGRHTGQVMIGAAMLFGLFVAAFAVSRWMPLSMGLLFAGGFFASIYLNLGMTTLQLLVPPALRGRVMGIWGLTWFLSSAGGFVAASLAELLGTPVAVALGASAVSLFALVVLATSRELRGLRAPPAALPGV